MTLETNRLRIRPLTLEDKDAFFAYRRDKEANAFQGWIPDRPEDVDAFMSRVAQVINTPETWFQLAMVLKENELVIGDIGLHFVDPENLQVELGCTLSKDFQNQGFATEALTRVMDYLFNDLKKHRVYTSMDPQNAPSIQLVERIGFRKEAHFIKSLFINGTWVDDVVYALLREEWNQIHPH